MFDTSPDGFLRLIKEGETKNVEFKLRLPPDDIIAKVLSSFANTDGGILIIGLKDDGELVGLTNNEIRESTIRIEKISSSLLPIPFEYGTVGIHGKKLVYFIINKVPEYQLPITTSKGEIFQRLGIRTVPTRASKLLEMLKGVETIKAGPNKIAFVAMSFKYEEEPALVDYYRAMDRAVKATNLPIEIKRIDLVEGDYEISKKIMDEIDNCDIVIADFTLNSRNVYFELGYARGKSRRIIQTARKGTNLEFDIKNWRTLFYRNATEFEEKLIDELKKAYEDVST